MNPENDAERRWKITLAVYGLRAKNFLYSVVQFTGWAILFFGIHQLATPFLLLLGYDLTLPAPVASAAPELAFIEAIGVMFAGMIIVWISTASWF